MMPEVVPMSEKDASRKLRAHKKSRRGCGNCKLRAVKCDETRPVCKRCKAYGVVCNYDRKSPDLELSAKGSSGVFQISIINDCTSPPTKENVPRSIAPSLKQGLAASLASNTSRVLLDTDFELLHRFQTRTICTVTTPRSLPVYQSSILRYASSHPYLLHAVLTLTLLHDRHLSPISCDASLSTTEAYQWGQCIALYSRALSQPILPSSRDALWATAAFLGILSIAHVEARTPEESWPYAPPSSMDLNWLRMGDGKKEIWKDGKAFLEESEFRMLAVELKGHYAPSLTFGSAEGVKVLPTGFLAYFGLLEGSDLVDNPYTAPVFSLAQTWKISSVFNRIMNFIFYITNMESRYRVLLEWKDPRALLLLAYWWRMIAETKHWHMYRRAVIECQSICLYLDREYGNDLALQSLLAYPRSVWDFTCN